MIKRAAFILAVALGVIAWPVFGFDFTNWRTDGIQVRGSSVGQQSSNQAFNLFDRLMDAANSNFALYWVGELQESGGTTTPPWGDSPPTAAIRDNRIQEPDLTWATWPVVTGKTIAMPRPAFTPNIPQAWNPVVVDLEQGSGQPDHVLISASFEPPAAGGLGTREQILNAYYPQTGTGLPGNNTDTSIVPASQRGTVRPLWVRAGGRPGLRIRDLAPLRDSDSDLPNNPGTGVITQPPIFARVPAFYKIGDQVIAEVLPVVFLVVGTGERLGGADDYARVICLTLQQPRGANANPPTDTWLPNPANAVPDRLYPTFAPPDGALFDPNGGGGGAVMWSYQVQNRAGNAPAPVAGISFANIGDSSDSRPALFLTTGDGQVICLNAKASDRSGFTTDGDPLAGEERWKTALAARTPQTTGVQEDVGFLYGMAPAVARVPLTGMFGATPPAAASNTINRALTQHSVSEWMLFVADTYGTFWGFDAPGRPTLAGGQISGYTPQVRWQLDPPNNGGNTDFRRDRLTNRERFIVPPVVYQGNTPLNRANGSLVAGSSDVGLDDEVIFTSERGRLYAVDALGKLRVGGADDGRPEVLVVGNPAAEPGTALRWTYPDDDTEMLPPTGSNGAVEPQVWPRELPDPTIGPPASNTSPDVNNHQLIERTLGKAVRDLRNGAPPGSDGDNPNRDGANYRVIVQRAPVAVALGGGADPNGAAPNQDLGDDVIAVPYQVIMNDGGATRQIYEYLGTMKPYGFAQMVRPVLQVDSVIAIIGGTRYTMPLNHVRVGSVKSNGVSSNQSPTLITQGGAPLSGAANPFLSRGAAPEDDTIYVVDPVWYDDATSAWVRLPLGWRGGAQLEVTYRPPSALNSATPGAPVTETVSYPSCLRRVETDPDDDVAGAGNPEKADPSDPLDGVIVRSVASLSEQHTRLEQEKVVDLRDLPGNGNGLKRGFDIGRGNGVRRLRFDITSEYPAEVDATEWDNFDYRPPAPFGAGSASAGGTLMAPSMFRGRINAYSHSLRLQRIILGKYDPRLDPAVGAGQPAPPYGPGPGNTYDPGLFYDPDGDNDTSRREQGVPDFVDEIISASDPGASVTLVDGWLYVTHRNGHTRGYSVVGGGASGTVGGNPPLFQPPGPEGNTGNVVKAPVNIYLLNGPDPNSGFRSWAGDEPMLLEWGETLYVLVDFGPEGSIVRPGSLRNQDLNNLSQVFIDAQVLRNQVQAQIRSSNGAVQQLAANRNTAMPIVMDVPALGGRRVAALVQVFAGVPSPSNPLTPGTPLLWERQPAAPKNDFDGEVTYDIQITQQGLQWYWAQPPGGGQSLDSKAIHFWEAERNQTQPPAAGLPQQSVRYPTTGGTTGGARNWYPNPAQPMSDPANVPTAQWAPLVSYNNPIMVAYTPGGGAIGMQGSGAPVSVIPSNAAGAPMARFTDRREQGRKNGDQYADAQVVDGSRSGSGRPVVPVVGMPIAPGGGARQILFADHGKTTPTSTTLFPEMAVLRIADRSLLASTGRPLALRAQRAPLTKIGKGAFYGIAGDASLANAGGPAAPAGSWEQNARYLDDAPDQNYPSVAENRLRISRFGTELDLSSSVATVPGRIQTPGGWLLPDFTNNSQVERIAVQVDIPPYTPDDIYSTRWRSSASVGVQSGAPPASAFNPFFPGPALFGDPARALWDRPERIGRGPAQGVPDLAPGEDQLASPLETINPNADDRFRRVMLFNDANGNGQLDLLPNYREAYRTFAVQVVVKPDPRLEAAPSLVDLGNEWHGKKQPGLPGAPTKDIEEWQRMQAALAGQAPFNSAAEQSVARFYQQYWRPFQLRNTGNVNLAYLKPEVAYELPGQPAQLIALPAEGNDPWRALPLINLRSNAALVDPTQIFLRTSFDDQLLPDASAPYGGGSRGAWLQKAVVGAGEPGAVIYTHSAPVVSPNPLGRDPSTGGAPRATWITLNIPTGAPLGQYSGTIRFFNDRGVVFLQDAAAGPHGYRYVRPENVPGNGGNPSALDGVLSRRNDGLAIEPATNPSLRIKARVMENLVQGRYASSGGAQDPSDRRIQPAASPDLRSSSSTGQVRGLLLSYATNIAGLLMPQPQASNYDIFGTQLLFDTNRLLFPFDELPLDRPPWATLAGNAAGATQMTSVPFGMQATRPSIAQFGSGIPLLAWTQRYSTGTSLEYGVLYKPFNQANAAPVLLWPLGSSADPVSQLSNLRQTKSSVRIQPFMAPGNQPAWFAFYASGQATRRNLVYSFSTNPAQVDVVSDARWPARWPNQLAVGWSPEVTLPTSRSLSTVNDPFIFTTPQTQRVSALPAQPGEPAYIQQERQALPEMSWVTYSGTSQRRGLTDIYLSRFRTLSLASQARRSGPGGAATPDPLRGGEDFGLVTFPRIERDQLVASPSRTLFTARGGDWIIKPYSQVQVYIGLPQLPPGQAGSLTTPQSIIAVNQVGSPSSSGEVIFPLDPALLAGAGPNSPLRRVRVIVDPAAGVVRLTSDLRAVARLIFTSVSFNAGSPDPVLFADYTPSNLRITRGDVSANNAVVVPVISQPGQKPVMDASWYRQQIDPGKWAAGLPVAGTADRVWVFWRRAAGAVSGGPSLFYKVLRPGIRVKSGRIWGIRPGELNVAGSFGGVVPEEVNPEKGHIYVPYTHEGQRLSVSYQTTPGSAALTQEEHVVTWLEETPEQPIPMETAVNEGSVDAFASFEDVGMTQLGGGSIGGGGARKMEKIWVFWSSTRGTGGDIFYATVAPRIGPYPSVGSSVTLFATSSPGFAALSGARRQSLLQAAAAADQNRPFTLPSITRRGPLLQGAGSRRPPRR